MGEEDRSEEIEKQLALTKNKMLELERKFDDTMSDDVLKILQTLTARVELLESKLKNAEGKTDGRDNQNRQHNPIFGW